MLKKCINNNIIIFTCNIMTETYIISGRIEMINFPLTKD